MFDCRFSLCLHDTFFCYPSVTKFFLHVATNSRNELEPATHPNQQTKQAREKSGALGGVTR